MKVLALFVLICTGCIGSHKTPERAAPAPDKLAQAQAEWEQEAGRYILSDTTSTK